MKDKKAQLLVIFISATLMLTLIIGFIALGINGWHYQTLYNGEHTGSITAIETTGIFFKTTTVYFKSDVQSSQEDMYCLIDESLIPELKLLSENKSKVTIKYIDYLVKGDKYCNSEPGGIIVGIK